MNISYDFSEYVIGKLSQDEKRYIENCRLKFTKLGFLYQLIFVKVFNRFPQQKPFEIHKEILAFASAQIRIKTQYIEHYQKRRQTIADHQNQITQLLNVQHYDEESLKQFLFEEAQRIESSDTLLNKAHSFLRERKILQPSDDTLKRRIVTQRENAKQYILNRIVSLLNEETIAKLELLLDTSLNRISIFQQLKIPPDIPSARALISLTKNLEIIENTNITQLDFSWLNNNYQRNLAKYAVRISVDRLSKLKKEHKYTVLICFLIQTKQETIDHLIDMYFKLMTKIQNHAKQQFDEALIKKRKTLKKSLLQYQLLAKVILDENVADPDLRKELFAKVDKEAIQEALLESEDWLTGSYSHVFPIIQKRFSYLRQFSPVLLKSLNFEIENASMQKAISVLEEMNNKNKKTLPKDAPTDFISKKLMPYVVKDGKIDKSAWECALFMKLKNEIKIGNIHVKGSKRFDSFDHFFIPEHEWKQMRSAFFQKSKLPEESGKVESYFKERLNKAYDAFLASYDKNMFAKIDASQWILSVDQPETLSTKEKEALENLHYLLSSKMRQIKLPDLLIEVNNDLHFTKSFIDTRNPQEICSVLATIMAHGCFIGPYTMARLTQGVTYDQIRTITDWKLTEDAQRSALAIVVNGISKLDITKNWGIGKTSSSDERRHSFKRKMLNQTFSARLQDFAIGFYTFIADNYAPYYSLVKETAERDAPYVLDGILYNESDLIIEEHFTDTHGYTEINFTAFSMLGVKFSPRIKGVKHQRIYCIDQEKDYGCLKSLIDDNIRMDWIVDQWDHMGHFYASLEKGHVTASTALKRLNAFSPQNHFYRANRELGRIFKTESILEYLSDPIFRKRQRQGLLKGEQMNQLARHVAFGKRGRVTPRNFYEQKNTCSCLTLIMSCIVYWQAKEIGRIMTDSSDQLDDLMIAMIVHISPIGWDNLILYGEYILNKDLIR